MEKPHGLYWARIKNDGGGVGDDITIVDLDPEGDIWTLGTDQPLHPRQVVLLGLAVPPAGLEEA
ncbi:hypothetical protein [Rhodoplanes roseus]|uniref:Uncharacterized protein n=1 Tax=Rhodoplanes roseus TaxID=29409 RepID=A0A327KYN0_9BRAD|nr:hypothetical protein [Rhodoplanes roseus]RAI42695.1 hypothetical protein CH341_18160 [Rhodoplanes roseus]